MPTIIATGSADDPLTELKVTLLQGGLTADSSLMVPEDGIIYLADGAEVDLRIPSRAYLGANTDGIQQMQDRDLTLLGYTVGRLTWYSTFTGSTYIGNDAGLSLSGSIDDGYRLHGIFRATVDEVSQVKTTTAWKGRIQIYSKKKYFNIGLATTTDTYFNRSFTLCTIPKSGMEQAPIQGSLKQDMPIDSQSEAVFMTMPSSEVNCLLYAANSDYNAISSYSYVAGSEQPFDYVRLEISKKYLTVLAPDLVDRIVAGKNVVTVVGPGQGQYIVTSVKKNSDSWTVIAYSIAEQLRSATLHREMILNPTNTPASIIRDLVSYGLSTMVSRIPGQGEPITQMVWLYKQVYNTWPPEKDGPSEEDEYNAVFPVGTNIWYIINICALKLGCKVWVANSVMYIVDTDYNPSDRASYFMSPDPDVSGIPFFRDIDTIYLNRSGVFPYFVDKDQEALLSNIVGLPEPGKEGQEVLRNKIKVSFNEKTDQRTFNSDNRVTEPTEQAGQSKGTIESIPYYVYITDDIKWVYRPQSLSETIGGVTYDMTLVRDSMEYFSEKQFSYAIPEIGYNAAKSIADLTAKKYCDAETSISFEVREMIEDESALSTIPVRKWYPTFQPLTRVGNIVDYSNDLSIDTRCNFTSGVVMRSKGMLSLLERRFPEHITKYTFGIHTPTDMSQNTSIIQNAIRNG